MRKAFWLLVPFLCLAGSLTAQQMVFCESVDAAGKPSGASSAFSITSQGSFLNILVTLKKPAGAVKVIYDIYHLQDGKEVFESSSPLNVQPEWSWFNKGFTFYKPGDYAVYVYGEDEKLIVSGKLKLVMKK